MAERNTYHGKIQREFAMKRDELAKECNIQTENSPSSTKPDSPTGEKADQQTAQTET